MYSYEVEMTVDDSILDGYIVWLKSHIQEMLALPCFTSCSLFRGTTSNEGSTLLRASYSYLNESDLQTYLEQYAENMRGALSSEMKSKVSFSRKHFQRLG